MNPPTPRPPFVPWDIEIARINFSANCGPSSFAAITEREVCRVMRFFQHFEHSPWTNLTQMRRAFAEAGYEHEVHRREMPQHGVALIQWLGSWTRADFFSRWSLPYTHWVAVEGDWVFDYTVAEWQTVADWQHRTVPSFLAKIPHACGWAVKYGIEVSKYKSPCRGSVNGNCVSSFESELNLSS